MTTDGQSAYWIIVSSPDSFARSREIGCASLVAFVAKWPTAAWTRAFQGYVHAIIESDFELIRAALSKR